MRYLRMIATLAAVVACTVPGRAESVIPAKLSVADAVAIALGTNADLKQAEEGKKASLSQLRIAGFDTSLNLSASTGFVRSSGDSVGSSLVSTQLTYSSPFGTKASLDFSPLGLGSDNRGSLGASVR